MDKNNVFGDRLRMLRSIRGNKSQKEFAEELRIPQPSLSAYESGKNKPTVDAIIKIAERCGVSVDWLCGRDEVFHLGSLGDVLSCFLELYETKEFSIHTTIHDRVDIEEKDATDDDNRNWIDLRIYHNESWHDPECTLNMDLCQVITKAYTLTQELRRYESSQEDYELKKKHSIDYYSDAPITKIDHSDISEEERRRRMYEIMKKEMENGDNKGLMLVKSKDNKKKQTV